MVSDGTEFAVGDIERLFDEARRNTKVKHEKRDKYYNRRRLDVQIKVNDWILIKMHPLSSATKKVVAKFKLKFEGPYSVRNQGERHTVKADKRGPLIRSPPGSWFEPSRKIKRRRKEIIGYKRSRESGSVGPERKIKNGLEHRVTKRALSSNYNNDLQKVRKKGRTEETVMPCTSGYNLRPKKGAKVESRPTIEMKTQQGGLFRARNCREKYYRPYIEEQARSGSKNTRRGSQQQNGQERKGGANTNRSISLKVIVGDVNYTSHKIQVVCVSFHFIFRASGRRIIVEKQVRAVYLKLISPSKS
ncbi:uncharacterized protein TNCV_3611911 [Trichonephila clavipes]|nr:uncharacterized protein TNCV_3611911 [Trichonephila clavipes]